MPRQDVPYGGAICRLKERIAEIWDELGKKLHSINGVEGDGAGDVKIVSGDAAIVITSDQVNHQIEVALDSSQLPAAAVASVNGQTGAVVLDANDIDAGLTPPGTSVAQDLAGTKQQMQVIGGLVQQEILDRQNADSTLQGNINAALATIPGEVSSQIANDATIAQLVTADGQNVKLSGSQNITGAKTVPTEGTGTFSQQIANSNKVKNELDNYTPMVRTTGNQTIAGTKSFGDLSETGIINRMGVNIPIVSGSRGRWHLVYTFTGNNNHTINGTFLLTMGVNTLIVTFEFFGWGYAPAIVYLGNFGTDNLAVCYSGGVGYVFVLNNGGGYSNRSMISRIAENYDGYPNSNRITPHSPGYWSLDEANSMFVNSDTSETIVYTQLTKAVP